MPKLVDATTIKGIATPYSNIDIEYFDTNIEYWQFKYLKPLLTDDLYNDMLANAGSFPAEQQTLIDDFIQYAMAYGVAFLTLKKDIMVQMSNQGSMVNRTDYSQANSNKMLLKEMKEREFKYLYELGCYLIDNKDTYTDFDFENSCLGTDFRDFVIL